MEVKLRIVIASHLSDVQSEMVFPELRDQANDRLNFVKYLIFKYPDTSKEIDPEFEYERF